MAHGLREAAGIQRSAENGEKLHLLEGLSKILLDIDRAIEIIRHTEEEAEVVPNLMIASHRRGAGGVCGGDQAPEHQPEYILKRTEETSRLRDEIADLEDLLGSRRRIRGVITGELRDVIRNTARRAKQRSSMRTSWRNSPRTRRNRITGNAVSIPGGYFKRSRPSPFA
jgi:DNA gyrase subunit A